VGNLSCVGKNCENENGSMEYHMPKSPKRHGWLVTALQDRGYQQRDLAKAWGINDAVVTRFISTGKPDLTPERQISLARMLDMDHNELMARLFGVPKHQQQHRAPVELTPPGARAPAHANGGDVAQTILEVQRGIDNLRRLLPGVTITFKIGDNP
jgi:plasmid maintenance system antidote protein VapI